MFRTSSVRHQERFVQAVCCNLVRGNMRTTQQVQPLQSNTLCILLHCIYIMQINLQAFNLTQLCHIYYLQILATSVGHRGP